MEEVRDVIGFDPHHKQWEVLENATRFTTLCWGRRSGKTMLAAYLALKYLLSNHPKKDSDGNITGVEGNKIWICAPTYDLAKRSWDYLVPWVKKINNQIGQFVKINKSHNSLEAYSDSKLELKSTDNASSMLGEGLDLLIVDEAARVNEEVWRQTLRPTLTDRQGNAVLISTPWGKNWFYDMKLKGTDEDERYDDYSYFHMKTHENPTLPNIEQEMELAQREMPENDYRQEHLAEFIEGAGQVFRGVRDCVYEADFDGFPFQDGEPDTNHVFQGGLDLARKEDFTVLSIVDKNGDKFRVHGIDRFKELDYSMQKPRLNLFSSDYNDPPINAEENAVGEAVVEDLNGNFEPFRTTNKSKKGLIENLVILIEQGKIEIPNIPQLIEELEAFTYEFTQSGRIKYSAPSGYHDDMVMSLALACKDLKSPIRDTRETTSPHYQPDSSYQYEEY